MGTNTTSETPRLSNTFYSVPMAAIAQTVAPIAARSAVARRAARNFVSNGTEKACSAMMVWTPNDNKFFETGSYLPAFGDAQIQKSTDYLLKNGWTPCVEFSYPEEALTLDHGKHLDSSISACYYDNRYWTMWKLPMYGCTDANQVLAEIQKCIAAFPDAYVRICSFDNIQQVQTAGFLAYRPPSDPAIPSDKRSV